MSLAVGVKISGLIAAAQITVVNTSDYRFVGRHSMSLARGVTISRLIAAAQITVVNTVDYRFVRIVGSYFPS